MAATLIASRHQLPSLSSIRPLYRLGRTRPYPSRMAIDPPPFRPDRRSFSTASSLNSPTGSSGPFTFHVAASFTGKDRRFDPTTHVFHFDSHNRFPQTKGSKSARPDSGHDAFFVSPVGTTNAVALGVADGVGGWVDSGVDPADFAHGLCEYISTAASEHESENPDAAETATPLPPSARNLLQVGYQRVCEDRTIRAGGSTACVAVAAPDGTLDVANLGDSGFLQLRLGAVHASSEPQTHAFNTPFQLSVVPPSVAARMAAFGGAQLSDFPRDADVSHHQLRHGDVLVFASDGVWDNLFDQDVLRITRRVMTSSGAWVTTPSDSEGQAVAEDNKGGIRVIDDLRPLTATQEQRSASSPSRVPVSLQSVLATEITAAAKAASINSKRDGPFAKEVQKWYPHENWRGGKVDDVVVVVAVVSDESRAGRPKSKL
ncbi:protein serine/threonine phosphatase 2C [Sodiomyces alkalinus F11]|uniref:Protein phosphatase n=1 Tax=Sodiomyces alkalinus (strain CBS 110278 / VKM F-3762 / F11) TaxID=1314773 RepID=A0A3N2PSM5_SODAK|nr:protein serine/threonine phosphatase 2C [Sodiomyces alkalinus F11]ROT37424.1 protein serine/threonine phosphatase 2C [Sodiomyces alkalinus F11]